MTAVQGYCDERFARLEEAFRANLEAGLDKGASLAVNLKGHTVVDLWGGTRDYAQVQPWEEDTVVRVFSTSKIVVMLSVLLLVDRGQLDLDAPIASYWPGFGRNGKEKITCRQVLVHRSGVPGFGRHVTFDDLGDWDLVVRILEEAKPWYEPGTLSCYHAQTFGYILGEVARRISGVPFCDFCEREITGPLGADFHFRLDPAEASRVSALWPAAEEWAFESEMAAAVMDELVTEGAEWIDPRYLGLGIPAASGLTNGRALARIGDVMAAGAGPGGRPLLSEGIRCQAGTEQSFVVDEMFGPMRLGLGFGMYSETFPAPTPTTIHWGGYGGSFLTMDPATGLSCGFAQNQLMAGEAYGDDPRMAGYWSLLSEISSRLD